MIEWPAVQCFMVSCPLAVTGFDLWGAVLAMGLVCTVYTALVSNSVTTGTNIYVDFSFSQQEVGDNWTEPWRMYGRCLAAVKWFSIKWKCWTQWLQCATRGYYNNELWTQAEILQRTCDFINFSGLLDLHLQHHGHSRIINVSHFICCHTSGL